MLLKPILSFFVVIQIIWRHAAQGQPNQQSERSDQESVNPPANPADCEEECQCEAEDMCQCDVEDDISNRCFRERKYCPVLQIPSNVISEGSCRKANPGDECRFKCKENLTLEGRDKLFCRSTLEWSDVVPQCKEYCPGLHIPANVISEGSCRKAKPGDECRFKCNENFPLKGVDKISCRSDLDWNAAVPQCKESRFCPKLQRPENADWDEECEQAEIGFVCFFVCNKGYAIEGQEKLTCSSSLEWDGSAPKCVKAESRFCPKLQKPENADWDEECEEAKIGFVCFFVCNKGYVIDGKEKLTCSSSLQWDGSEPHCVKGDFCPNTEKPKNAVLKGVCENARKGQECTVTCNDGYQIEGNGSLRCLSNLTWNRKPPRCVKKEFCPELQKPENANWHGKCINAGRGDECTVTCKEGYRMEGDGVLFCEEKLEWEEINVRCVEKDGPKPNASDCYDIKRKDPYSRRDGVYKIHLKGLNKSIDVFCDMKTDGGGWTVFQRRMQTTSKGENFFAYWADYKTGFGNLSEEFWLGNDYIHQLTNYDQQVLRIEIEDNQTRIRYAVYQHFSISDESNDYKLYLRTFNGGDAGDSLLQHNGRGFATRDHGSESGKAAADKFNGGWWYIDIHSIYSNLNGLNLRGPYTSFANGIMWVTWHGRQYSLMKSEMKIRPASYQRQIII